MAVMIERTQMTATCESSLKGRVVSSRNHPPDSVQHPLEADLKVKERPWEQLIYESSKTDGQTKNSLSPAGVERR